MRRLFTVDLSIAVATESAIREMGTLINMAEAIKSAAG